MYDTMEEFYKAKYDEANEERFKYLRATSQLTGYFSTLAKYSSGMPAKERIRVFERLIELWIDTDPDSSLTQEWIKSWEEEIKKLSV